MSEQTIIRILIGLFFMLFHPLLSGCKPHVVDQNPLPLVDTSGSYSISVEGIQTQNRWWKAFNDPDLDTIISLSLTDNFSLKQARSRIEQAAADDKQASSLLYPEISGKASGERVWKEDREDDTFIAGLLLSWELDLWGRLSSSRNASTHEITAAQEELEAAALLLTSLVAETYFELIEQKLKLRLLSKQIDSGKTLLELTELRFAYGEASIVDVFQQRQQLASTKTRIPEAKSRYSVLNNRLNILLGRPPSGKALPLADQLPGLPDYPSTGVPSDLLKNRPDLRRIHNELVAVDYRIAEAVADRLPAIELSANALYRDNDLSDGMLYSILLEAAAPIIDWERRSSEVDKRKAKLKEELYRYSHAYLTAMEEVENALWQEHHQKELLKALEHQINIARSNLTETRNRYGQGLTDYLPVLTALQSLQVLERDILQNRRQIYSFRILLYRALGGYRLTEINYKTSELSRTGAVK